MNNSHMIWNNPNRCFEYNKETDAERILFYKSRHYDEKGVFILLFDNTFIW